MLGGQIRVVLTLDDKDFTVRTVKASQAVSDFRGQLTRMVSSTERAESGISTLGDRFRAFTFNISLLRFAFADLNEIFLALPKSIIKTTAEFERMTQLMKGLSKETTDFAKAADAAKGVQFITDMAQKAPFAMSALTNAFVKFKTGGLDPMDGSLQALVDGIAKVGGTSEHLARASIAIQQMAGKGVVSMEELRQQLGEAVPTAIQAMARGMGMTMQELTGHIAKGEVTARAALSRMFDVMAFENRGAAAEMMQTWTGMFEQLKTKWELFKLEAGKGEFFAEAKKELQNLIDMFDQPQAKALAADINAALASMVRGIRTLVEAWDKYGEVIKTVAEIFIGYWAITKVANIMGGITSSMRNAYAQQVTDARDAATRRAEILDQEVARRRRQADQMLQVVAEQNARARKLDQDAKSLMGDANKIDQGGRADLSLTQERQVDAIRAKAAALQQEAQNLRQSAAAQWQHADATSKGATAIERQVGVLNRAIASNSANMEILRTGQSTVDRIAASQEKHAVALNAVSFASRGMGAAMLGLRTVFAAMGGWVTIAITALTALAAKLYSIITTADRARRAVELAQRGVYTDEGIADQKKVVGSAGDQVKSANSALEFARQRGWDAAREGTAQRAEYDKLLAAQRKAQEDYAKADSDLRKMMTLKQDDAVNVSVQEFERNVSREATAKAVSYNQQIQAQQAAMEKALEEAQKKNPKLSKDEADKITKPFITEQNNLQKQAAKETVGIYQGKVNDLLTALKSVQIGSDKEKQLQGQLKVATDKLTSAKAESEKWSAELGTAILGGGKDKKGGGKPQVPPLTKMAETKEGELDALKIKLDALLSKSRSVATIEQEIRAEMEGELAGGKFDFKAGVGPKAGYVQIRDLDTLKKYSDQYRQFQKAVQDKTSIAVLNEQIRIVEKLTQDQAKGLEEAKQAWEQLNNEGVKPLVGSLGQTVAAYDALFAKLPQGVANLEQLTAFRNAAISQQAEAELAKELANRLQDSKKRSAQLVTDTTERNRRIYEIEVEHENAVYRAEVASAERIVGNDTAKNRLLEEATRAHGLRMRELTDQFRMTDPLERMRAQFEDLSNNMRQDAAGWGKSLIDMMVDGAKTGDYKLADYFKNLLGDIYRNILQNVWAKPFQEFFGSIADRAAAAGKTMAEQFNGGAGPAASGGADGAAAAGGDFLSKLWDSITGTSDAADKTTGSLQTLATSGAKQLTGVFVDTALKGATQSTATAVATNALWNLAAAAQAAAASMGGGSGGSGIWGMIGQGVASIASAYAGAGGASGGMFGGSTATYSDGAGLGGAWNPNGTGSVPLKFANGGIMTQWGELPLRAYSKGGIANRPQAAIFGEGSVPEAYVPLPDGRSIPVTMAGGAGGSGGAAPVVTVNVINQTGTQANAQQGQARFDGKQWVLDVVMTAASQPGPFRDNMKGALK